MKRNARLKIIFKNYYIFLRDFLSDLFDDKLGHYASSLSWSTLFSIIPLLVILLFIFTTLPIFDSVYHQIEKLIFSNLMPTDSKEVMDYINTFMENSDKLGAVGAFYVIFAAIMFFKNYDYIVNDIFGVPTRTIWGAIKTYLLLILIIPTMIGGSFYLSTFSKAIWTKTVLHLSYTFTPFYLTLSFG